MSEPPVSVLMTTFNRSKYVGTAIESVLASTMSEFELVVVDDGSSDGTQDVVRGYASRDGRVKFYQNETNLGDYPNRNRAAQLAKGTWLKYVDADDYIYPNGLDVMLTMLNAHPEAGYGLCSIGQLLEKPFPVCLKPEDAYRHNYFRKSIFHKAPLSSIIRRDAWEKIGGFAPERMTGDTEMWHRLSKQYSVVLMPYGIVWYREHDEQETATRLLDEVYWATRYHAITKRALLDPETPLTYEEKCKIAQRFIRSSIARAGRALLVGNFGDARLLISSAHSYLLAKRELQN